MKRGMEYKSGSPHRRTQPQLKGTGFHAASQQTSRIAAVGSVSLYRGNVAQNKYEFVQRAPESLDLAKPFHGVLQLTKVNEKELLHGLNDRFAGFIEKVRQLENHNQLLEKEIEAIRQKAQSPSSVAQEYETELRDLRKLVQDITLQKRQIEVERENLEDDFLTLREKYDKEAQNRSDAENSITVLKKGTSDAYLAKLQLDKKAQSLVDEIHFLKKHHEAEVSEMVAHIQEAQVKIEAHDFGKHDLTAALRDIRAQLEGYAAFDIQQADECFRAQFAKMNKAAETNREALKATSLEMQESRRRLQGKNLELDCAKGAREGLGRQLRELEERHDKEIIHYQDAIKQLENELINTKFDMSAYLREYQDLLNVKMALDVEILSYRQLLEGEENHLSTISDTHISTSYIYRQSPVYTLPRPARQGSRSRWAEPQYKFVEEILTETTREVETSGSEGGEGEDQGGVEPESRSSGGEDVTPEEEGVHVHTSSEEMDHGDAGSPDQGEEAEEAENEEGGEVDEIATPDQNKLQDSERPQELEGAREVQEDALPVPSEKGRKPTDITVEPNTNLAKETAMPVMSSEGDNAQRIPSKTPENDDKVPEIPEKVVSPTKEKLSSPGKTVKTVMSSGGDKAQGILSQTPEHDNKVPEIPEKEVSPTKEKLSSPEETVKTEVTVKMVMSSEGDKAQGIPSKTPEHDDKGPESPKKEVSPTKEKLSSPEEIVKTVMSSGGDKAQEILSQTPEHDNKVPEIPEKEVSPTKEKLSSPVETVKTVMSSEGDKAQGIPSKTPEHDDKGPEIPKKEVSPTKEKLSSPEETVKTVMSSEGDKAQGIPSKTPEHDDKGPEIPEKEVSPTKEKLSSPEETVKTEVTVKMVMSSEGDKAQGIPSKTPEHDDKGPEIPKKEVSPTKEKLSSPEETVKTVMSSEGDKAQGIPSKTPEHDDKGPEIPEKDVSPTKEKLSSPEETVKTVMSSEGDKAQEILSQTPEHDNKVPEIPEKEVSPTKEKLSSPEETVKTEVKVKMVMSSEGDKAQGIPSKTPEHDDKGPEIPKKEVSPTKEKLSSPEETVKTVMSSEGDKAQGIPSKTPEHDDKGPEIPEKVVSPTKEKLSSPGETVKTVMSSGGDKAQEILSQTPEHDEKGPEIPEKDVSPTKEKLSSPEEIVKTVEAVKTVMSETSPTSYVNEKTSSGEQAETDSEKSETPKKQAAAVVENKDLHKGVPDCSTTQTKSEHVKEPEKMSDPKDGTLETETVKVSETIIDGPKEGKSEHAEVAATKNAAVEQQDVSVKEKMVDGKLTKQTSSVENSLAEGNGTDKEGKSDAKLSNGQVEPVEQKKADSKTSV